MFDNFILDHPLAEDETVEVSVDAGAHTIVPTLFDEDKTDNRLAVKYTFADANPYYGNVDYTTTLTIKYKGETKFSQTIDGMSVRLNEPYATMYKY